MRCRYERGEWGECDKSTNHVSMTLTLKQGSGEKCVPTQIKSIPCDRLEQLKAWKAKKEEKRQWKKHKKAVKEKFGLGCKFDVSVSECDAETNMVTKTYTPKSGDTTVCQPETISFSCQLHEKLMKWKQRRQDKRMNRRNRKKGKHLHRINKRQRMRS